MTASDTMFVPPPGAGDVQLIGPGTVHERGVDDLEGPFEVKTPAANDPAEVVQAQGEPAPVRRELDAYVVLRTKDAPQLGRTA